MSQRIVIGLHGFTGVGKDEIAKHLVAKHGFTRVAFADPMRKGLLGLDPWIWDPTRDEYCRLTRTIERDGWDWAKRSIPDVRVLMQRYGTEAGRQIHGENCWLRLADDVVCRHDRTVLTDVRFANEVDMIREWRTVPNCAPRLWRIHREGHGSLSSHASESELADAKFDAEILNNSTIEALYEQVDAHLAKIVS